MGAGRNPTRPGRAWAWRPLETYSWAPLPERQLAQDRPGGAIAHGELIAHSRLAAHERKSDRPEGGGEDRAREAPDRAFPESQLGTRLDGLREAHSA